MSSDANPDPSSWTLRLKYHRTTILLYTSPTSSFDSIKSNLLSSLRATNLSSLPPNNVPIPTSPDDVILGLPVDRNDLNRGWVPLLIPEEGDAEDDVEAGKGKTKGSKGVKKDSIFNASPIGAGLRDGAVLAFRFKEEGDSDQGDGEGKWDVVIPEFEEEEADGEPMET